MKHIATNTGVIMLALVAVAGVSLFFNFDEIFTPDNKISTSSAMIIGNVEAVKRDGAGNIVAYRQGDNHIVLGGMELIARQVFGNAGGGNNTNSSIFDLGNLKNYGGGVVQYMEIGNGTTSPKNSCVTGNIGTPTLGFDNVTLECPLYLVDQADPCERVLSLINRFNATEQPPTPSDAAQLNMTAVATFSGATPNSCAANNIGEAGIWTNASVGPANYVNKTVSQLEGNLMFARNTFGTVNLSTSDSLELTWKFTFTDN
jgi:hypothetical protein